LAEDPGAGAELRREAQRDAVVIYERFVALGASTSLGENQLINQLINYLLTHLLN